MGGMTNYQNAPQLKREAYLPHRKPNSKKVPPTSLTSIKLGNTEAKSQENRTTRSWREELLTERINWGKANSLLDSNRNATPTCKKKAWRFLLVNQSLTRTTEKSRSLGSATKSLTKGAEREGRLRRKVLNEAEGHSGMTRALFALQRRNFFIAWTICYRGRHNQLLSASSPGPISSPLSTYFELNQGT